MHEVEKQNDWDATNQRGHSLRQENMNEAALRIMDGLERLSWLKSVSSSAGSER